MFRKFLLIVMSAAITQMAVAQIIQCPTNTQFVDIGDSLPYVLQQCGKPKKILRVKAASQAQLWQYAAPTAGSNYPFQGFVLIFVDGRVKQIRVGPVTIVDSLRCQNGSVVLGSTMAEAEQYCGTPNAKQEMEYPPADDEQQGNNNDNSADNNVPEVIKLIYQPHDYLPQTAFIFKDGKLAEVQETNE